MTMVVFVLFQPQFNSQEKLHQFSSQPTAEEMLQLQRRFGSSASITPSDSTAQLTQHGLDDDDMTDDVRGTCRRESVASTSSSRSVSFLRLRSHSLRYIETRGARFRLQSIVRLVLKLSLDQSQVRRSFVAT